MPFGDRKSERVALTHGLDVAMIAIDGTWQRAATLQDISETGARITVDGSLENLQLREFFLLLSRQGIVYRRCELVRVNQNELGIRFLKMETKPARRKSTTNGEGRKR